MKIRWLLFSGLAVLQCGEVGAFSAEEVIEPLNRRSSYEETIADEPVALPEYPDDQNLLEFSAGATNGNRYFIDGKSLTVGADGIVRYAIVVKTRGGASNITYEGIRCRNGQYRLFATGRGDRSWALAHNAEWRGIENNQINRHHFVLSREFFCPIGIPIASVTEGLDALRRGRHPSLPRFD